MGKGSRERVVPMGIPASKAVMDYIDKVRPLLLARGEAKPCLSLAAVSP